MPDPTELLVLCRLCLKESPQLEDIFGNTEESSSLVMRIMASVSLEIHKSDNLPKKICSPCRYQLEKSYVFRSKCRDNDTRLRRHVKLLSAGKSSSLLTDLEDDDDEDEFQQSLQYIRQVDGSREEERLKQWEQKVASMEQAFQLQKASLYDKMRLDVMVDRLKKRTDVGVMTEEEEQTPEEYVDTLDVSGSALETTKEQIRARINARLAKQEDAYMHMLQDEAQMDEEHLDNQTVEALDDDDEYQPSFTNEESQAESSLANHQSHFIITEVGSDTETYVLESEELRREEQDLYGSMEDSDDDDLEAVTSAVKAELADRPNLMVADNCMMKVEKDRDCTKVEVQATDGSVICMEFSTENSLKRKREASEALPCPYCELTFKTPKEKEAHLALHGKAHYCKACDKGFPSKSSLERHARTHTGEKPYSCDHCGKSFVQKEILKRHMYLHAEEKAFGCEHCDRRFNQRDQLRQHVNRCHTEDPVLETHNCSVCPKSFKYASGLSRHMAAHNGRLFVCHCGRSFNDSSAMKRHEWALHKKGEGPAPTAPEGKSKKGAK